MPAEHNMFIDATQEEVKEIKSKNLYFLLKGQSQLGVAMSLARIPPAHVTKGSLDVPMLGPKRLPKANGFLNGAEFMSTPWQHWIHYEGHESDGKYKEAPTAPATIIDPKLSDLGLSEVHATILVKLLTQGKYKNAGKAKSQIHRILTKFEEQEEQFSISEAFQSFDIFHASIKP